MYYLTAFLVLYFLSLSSVDVTAQTVNRTCGSYKLTFYTHKGAEIYIDGEELEYKVFRGIFSRTETQKTCDDILFVLNNEHLASPVALSAILESGDDVYATSLFIKGNATDRNGVWGLRYAHVPFAEQGDVKPLFVIGTDAPFDPMGSIDYSGWRPASIVDSVLKENYGSYSDFRDEGAFPIHWSDGPMKIGQYGLKICNPLAIPSGDTQAVVSSCFKS